MRLHPVSWLLVGVMAFALVDAALASATFILVWRGLQADGAEGAVGFLVREWYGRVGGYLIENLVWTVGSVIWLELLWRTLRGLRLRRRLLETPLEG